MKELPMYLKPNQVQSNLGISTNTLRDLKDKVFKKGIHYFIPTGLTHPLWNRDALLEWINGNESEEISTLVNDILNN
jgi:hypothetical protein